MLQLRWSVYAVIKRHIPALRNITATVEKLPALNLTLIPQILRARCGSLILITALYLCGRQRSLTYVF